MNRPARLACFAAAALIGLLPLTAGAETPSPSPSLDTILARPPAADFVELTSTAFDGHFTAHDYATLAGTSKTAAIENTLNREGFVDGFGHTWIQRSTNHVLLEAVLAFTGGRGAKRWLLAAEAGDKSDPSYVKADTADGLGTYYGGHFSFSASGTLGDVFSFVRGNDVFIVSAVSQKDDVLSLASTQARAQYDAAPDSTIPSSQWPENATTGSPAFQLGAAVGLVLAVVFVGAVIALVVVLVVRSRRPAPVPVYGGVAFPVLQFSPDGNYWYDGQGWRDASRDVPPAAQRSSDGTLWWDGRTWRPVPQQPQPLQQPPAG
jgi:hypothetical protein